MITPVQGSTDAAAHRGFWQRCGPREASTPAARALEVVRLATLVLILEVALLLAARSVGLSIGSPGTGREVNGMWENPWKLALLAVGVLPFLEELCFRFLPSRLLDLVTRKPQRAWWSLGILIAIGFGLAHNLEDEAGASTLRLFEGTHLDLASVPVTQMISGVFYWTLVRRWGFGACLLAHSYHNALALTLTSLG